MLRQTEDLHFLASSRLDNLFQGILAMPTELTRVRVMREGHNFPKSCFRGSKYFEPLNQTCVKIERVVSDL